MTEKNVWSTFLLKNRQLESYKVQHGNANGEQVTFSYENDKQQILLILAVIFKSSLQKNNKTGL